MHSIALTIFSIALTKLTNIHSVDDIKAFHCPCFSRWLDNGTGRLRPGWFVYRGVWFLIIDAAVFISNRWIHNLISVFFLEENLLYPKDFYNAKIYRLHRHLIRSMERSAQLRNQILCYVCLHSIIEGWTEPYMRSASDENTSFTQHD